MSTGRNLVPDKPGGTPNYWCTWWAQTYEASRGVTELPLLLDAAGAAKSRAAMHEETLCGPDGWLASLHPRARSDLFGVLDDGWDLPLAADDHQKSWFGSFELHPQRWPSCSGHPAERLKVPADRAKRAGWAGLGLWVCAQEATKELPETTVGSEAQKHYWRTRLAWCRDAGIAYWKVDWGKWGKHERMLEFRAMLSALAREVAPGLVVEQTVCRWPLNDFQGTSGRQSGRVVEQSLRAIAFSDSFRTYDVLTPLSVPTTLDRVGKFLEMGTAAAPALGLLHCEDEVTVAAVLGCVMGVMRHPRGRGQSVSLEICLGGPRFEPTRPLAKQMDEVARAVRWQRIAPAWSVGQSGHVSCSPQALFDEWDFLPGDTTFSPVTGKTVRQGAAAVIARGIDEPRVTAAGETPYVMASRHPNGAVAVGVMGRVAPGKGYFVPPADVRLHVGNAPGPIGVFGAMRSLTLTFNGDLTGKRIWAQDLLANHAADISHYVVLRGNELVLDGTLINTLGLPSAAVGDPSPPALVLQVGT